MRAWASAIVGAFLLSPAVAAAQFAAAPTLTGQETRITFNLADQYDPAISGNLIVYTDTRGVDRDIWYYDLATGTELPVTTAPGDQDLTDVSDGLIVYTDEANADVMVFDPGAAASTNLTAQSNSASIDPAIGQRLVAWTDNRDGNLEIYAKNLTTGEERRITNSADRDERPAVHQGTIAWQRCAAGICDVWTYDWASGTSRQLTNTPADDERLPDVYKNSVVYQGLRGGADKDIFFFDLATGQEKQLALPGDQVNPNISGDFVAFEDLASGVYKIRLWHVPSGAVFDINGGVSGAQFLNDIDGNRVVYTDDRNGQLDIYMYEFQANFPPGEGGPALPADCAHLDGARAVLDNIFDRNAGSPDVYEVDFAAEAGPGLICITNGLGGAPKVTAGVLGLNGHALVTPDGWKDPNGTVLSDVQRTDSLGAANHLQVALASQPGATIRVRVFQAAPTVQIDSYRDHRAQGIGASEEKLAGDSDTGSSKRGLTGEPQAFGCSQSGAGVFAPIALAMLALLALMPRPSAARVRARRRQ